ncbi:Elongation factor Ts [Mycoplasmopsis agalactiae]|uniref:translation elongation factor Ts n=1 Tax=Mycoplasmopsis agalactiae TaxID=2110 RepID=UPI000C70BD48|nr:translation elongation factor Ts [Mycoplasmopsis agalactiae]MCE6057031.1 elongation factor Ts [Mycoplasmopsis agalactiae]MCE6078817.1 elongation factor Ts [Mycoplasmopsis agalactiae]MCE6095201.1 elongation factor Ts [Mycoplasmopsis agalactiae]MCE6114457.1 elongation factor Ts [Mycoplasmopsis agalactiae]NLS34292.1 elongation factor Ts [Mycoplasmopsis agalactiae]
MDKMALIKELRERTAAGMSDCKKALEVSNWDVEEAISFLKKNGKIKAASKANRVSADGLLVEAGNNERAVLVELNCETDFVAHGEEFVALANTVAQTIVANFELVKENGAEAALALKLANSEEILADAISSYSAKCGEKIELRRFVLIDAGTNQSVSTFVHINGKIGAIMLTEGSDAEAARNVAMHLSAMNPEYIFAEDIPGSVLEKFASEFKEPAGFSDKPEKIQETIRKGFVDKKISEVTLLSQKLIMDESKTVQQYLKEHKLRLIKAIRFGLGEGIEKKETDFAAEVAEQMSKSM